jgi:hypothetical protein
MIRKQATPGDIFAALYAAHHVGDYWAQTGRQAQDKSLPGRQGRAACARHAAVMTGCKALSLAALSLSGRRVCWKRAVIALAADAGSHYWADRRVPLERLAHAVGATVSPGKGDYYANGGAPFLDQAWHIAWLQVAALITAGNDPA